MFCAKYKQNRAIIVRLLPYIISILILKHISLNAIYVSIFLILLMLFITFISSKIQNKKSFVKYSRRKSRLFTHGWDNKGTISKLHWRVVFSSSKMRKIQIWDIRKLVITNNGDFPSCRSGMGRRIERLIQSLNEKAVYV